MRNDRSIIFIFSFIRYDFNASDGAPRVLGEHADTVKATNYCAALGVHYNGVGLTVACMQMAFSRERGVGAGLSQGAF